MIEEAIAAAPIFIQPNAGKPVTRKGVTYDEQTSSEFAQDARILKENGADMIGGCCGTNPEFIQALSAALSGNSIADKKPWARGPAKNVFRKEGKNEKNNASISHFLDGGSSFCYRAFC